MVLKIVETSDISGRFSITQGPSESKTAGRMATAAFFAPLMRTSPCSGRPPFITNFSKKRTPRTKIQHNNESDLILLLPDNLNQSVKNF